MTDTDNLAVNTGGKRRLRPVRRARVATHFDSDGIESIRRLSIAESIGTPPPPPLSEVESIKMAVGKMTAPEAIYARERTPPPQISTLVPEDYMLEDLTSKKTFSNRTSAASKGSLEAPKNALEKSKERAASPLSAMGAANEEDEGSVKGLAAVAAVGAAAGATTAAVAGAVTGKSLEDKETNVPMTRRAKAAAAATAASATPTDSAPQVDDSPDTARVSKPRQRSVTGGLQPTQEQMQAAAALGLGAAGGAAGGAAYSSYADALLGIDEEAIYDKKLPPTPSAGGPVPIFTAPSTTATKAKPSALPVLGVAAPATKPVETFYSPPAATSNVLPSAIVQSEAAKHAAEVRELNETVTTMKTMIETQRDELESQANVFAALKTSSDQLRGDLEGAQAKVESLEEQIRRKDEEVGKLKGDLEDKASQLDTLKMERERIETDFTDNKDQLLAVYAEKERIEEKVEARDRELQELREELEKVKSELASKNEELRLVNEQRERLAEELAEKSEELETLRNAKHQADDTSAASTAQLKDLQIQLAAANQTIEDLQGMQRFKDIDAFGELDDEFVRLVKMEMGRFEQLLEEQSQQLEDLTKDVEEEKAFLDRQFTE